MLPDVLESEISLLFIIVEAAVLASIPFLLLGLLLPDDAPFAQGAFETLQLGRRHYCGAIRNPGVDQMQIS